MSRAHRARAVTGPWLGKNLSAEHKENIRLANIRTNAVARLGKRAPWNKGKKMPPRTLASRQKASETMKRLGHKPPRFAGPDHYNWKGGISHWSKKERQKPEYLRWRKAVLARDDNRCQKCGATDELRAHHIVNYIQVWEERHDIDNGITLCRSCHDHFHMRFGYWKNTLAQLNEFLARQASSQIIEAGV